jgi:hypothetical protein
MRSVRKEGVADRKSDLQTSSIEGIELRTENYIAGCWMGKGSGKLSWGSVFTACAKMPSLPSTKQLEIRSAYRY